MFVRAYIYIDINVHFWRCFLHPEVDFGLSDPDAAGHVTLHPTPSNLNPTPYTLQIQRQQAMLQEKLLASTPYPQQQQQQQQQQQHAPFSSHPPIDQLAPTGSRSAGGVVGGIGAQQQQQQQQPPFPQASVGSAQGYSNPFSTHELGINLPGPNHDQQQLFQQTRMHSAQQQQQQLSQGQPTPPAQSPIDSMMLMQQQQLSDSSLAPPSEGAFAGRGGVDGTSADGAASKVEFKVPSASAGIIVGKKATQIKKFRTECGVKVAPSINLSLGFRV